MGESGKKQSNVHYKRRCGAESRSLEILPPVETHTGQMPQTSNYPLDS